MCHNGIQQKNEQLVGCMRLDDGFEMCDRIVVNVCILLLHQQIKCRTSTYSSTMYDLLRKYFTDRTTIDDATFATICQHCQLVKAKRNEMLLMQGEICRYYYFVNKGCIRLFTLNSDGQEATRYFAFEGAFGSALPSLIQQKPAFEFVQAVEKSELLAFGRDDFFMLASTVPQVGLIYRQILEAAFITAQERIYGFQGLSALEKLRWLLAYQPNILTRLSNKMVASFLGVTPFTLSRLKAEL